MFDYQFNEEQLMVKSMVQKFVNEKIIPQASVIDKKDEFPWELFKEAAQLGLYSIELPAEYGGLEDPIASVIVFEEVARHSVSFANIINSVSMHLYCMDKFGTQEQKEKYIPKLASGELVGSFAVTEPDAGSDVSSMQTNAVKTKDGYIINGQKRFITFGPISDFTIVFCVTGKKEKGPEVTAFIVEKDRPGCIVGHKEKKLGQRGVPVSDLYFENCFVPDSNMLGQKGEGFRIALSSLDGGRINIAAVAVGLMQEALDISATYALERKQFNRPIGKFQLIQQILVEMACDLQASRNFVYQAAYKKSRNEKYTKEAAMAKYFATEAAMKHMSNAIQILGGYGYMEDYPLERMFRDAKLCQIYEGTNQIQQIVIAREILNEYMKSN